MKEEGSLAKMYIKNEEVKIDQEIVEEVKEDKKTGVSKIK